MMLAVLAISAVIFSVVCADGDVAFSAAVSDDKSYQINEIVKFENVFTNIGNGYNKFTGIFTAPKKGLYVFHVHGMSLPNSGFWFTLYRNDIPLIRAHGGETSVYNAGGNSIALTINSGDTLYVKVPFPSTVHGSYVNRYTTFTGYKISTESP